MDNSYHLDENNVSILENNETRIHIQKDPKFTLLPGEHHLIQYTLHIPENGGTWAAGKERGEITYESQNQLFVRNLFTKKKIR